MIKQSIARKLPILMQDSSGVPVTGLAFGDVSVKYAKEGDTSLTTKVLAADPVEWFEIGQGLYDILFTTTELNTIGFFKYVVTGGTALQYSGLMQISANLVDDIVKGVWDEVITAGTYNIKFSAGRRLRQIPSVIVHDGTAQGPGTGNNQIQLDAGASAVDNIYDPGLLYIVEGTGAGQSRLILDYDGSTKTCTVDSDWRINPDNTSEFLIVAHPGREHVNEGLSRGGTINSLILNVNAPSIDSFFGGQSILLRSGTGAGQVREILHYNGTTKKAIICENWAVTPDTTTTYEVLSDISKSCTIDKILETIEMGNVEEYKAFTYNGLGLLQEVEIKVGDKISPTTTFKITFAYDEEGKVTNMDIDKL